MSQTIFIKKYWSDGCHFRYITSDTSFVQVMPYDFGPSIEIRNYPNGGIEDCFDVDNGWKPCTQDEFVEAYVKAINQISAASGIEHLPLTITYDNTSNPES